MLPTAVSGGWLALGRYDDGVYLGMAVSLLHGELPYRDLVMLHPPGSTVLLAPLAGLAAVLPDHAVLVVARTATMVVGAVTAGGVAWLLRARGPRAMGFAGAAYAVFVPAVYADSSVTLESVANAVLVGAVLLLTPRSPSSRRVVVAGALLGLAATVKIWGVVPLLVVLVWLGLREGRAAVRRLALGAVGAVVVVCLPFFALAPTRMWRMVVLDQVGRPDTNPGPLVRLPAVMGAPRLDPSSGPLAHLAVDGAGCVIAGVFVWLVVRCVRAGEVLPAALLTTGLVVLLTSPSHFLQYGALVAVPLAWCVGGAVRGPRPAGGAALVLVLAAVCSLTLVPGRQLDPHFVQRVTATRGCLAADDPTVLIVTDTLSRNLRTGCPTWIDVTGTAYDIEGIRPADGEYVARGRNGYWRYGIVGPYLEGSEAFVLGRPSTGVDPDQLRYWERAAETTRSGAHTLFETTCHRRQDTTIVPFIRWVNEHRGDEEAALGRVHGSCR
ncbi:glycosyltransferase 87 family protein [Phycicoccus sp. DTK01]|uniref:glycosyltransferase 87 family protein n=1 Tax=Phycicoccus sp. DTK01 TaxID=2785745 RepID=UPI001A8FC9AC|nr:glycosyltransferase 87 family protein [Phycicoccus sp. DTK01]